MQLFQPSKQCHLLFPGWKFHPKVCSASIFNCEVSCCQKKWGCLNLASGGEGGEGGRLDLYCYCRECWIGLVWLAALQFALLCRTSQRVKPSIKTPMATLHPLLDVRAASAGSLQQLFLPLLPPVPWRGWIRGNSKVLRHWHSALCCDLL